MRYRLNDYSVPTTYGHRDVLVRGYVHEVVISCGAEVIARHPRSYEREDIPFRSLTFEHEDVLEVVQRRLDEHPEKMRQRRETVEHPFGTIKAQMGATHFLMKTLPRVA